MKFNVNQQDLQKSLNYCQGVIEKRSTLPILSNVLLEVAEYKLKLTATDLDLIFINQIPNVEIEEEGKTTTSVGLSVPALSKASANISISILILSAYGLFLENSKYSACLLYTSPSPRD